jgi:hypothetical protein
MSVPRYFTSETTFVEVLDACYGGRDPPHPCPDLR